MATFSNVNIIPGKFLSPNVPIMANFGVQFPANQVASSDANNLDDYEEGVWTPTLVGSGGGSATYAGDRVGFYTKIGNIVYITGRFSAVNRSSLSGSITISGLPFVSANVTGKFACVTTGLWTTSTSYVNMGGYVNINTSSITWSANTVAGSGFGNDVTATDLNATNTNSWTFSVVYPVS